MDGNNPGAISQTLNTVSGTTYTLTFQYANNPDSPNPLETMQVLVGGTVVGSVSHSNGLSWDTATYSFTASGSATSLEFQSTDTSGAWGIALANVSV